MRTQKRVPLADEDHLLLRDHETRFAHVRWQRAQAAGKGHWSQGNSAYQSAGSLSPRALARQTVPGGLQLAAIALAKSPTPERVRCQSEKERTNGIINMAARRPPAKGPTPDVDSSISTTPTSTIPTSNPPEAVSTTRKQPPVEKPSDIRRRTWVILSFWLIIVCLGLPIWWETTTIYRANLPLTEMLEWSDGKVWRHPF
jgi:hypothetical protein